MCGQTKIYGKFMDYLARREFDVGKFSIEMVESDHRAWKEIFLKYQAALLKMPCMQGRTLHWIGSTAVPDIPAKPIIDLLVGTDDVAETVRSIALCLSVDVWRRPCGLHFPLGFVDINKRCDDWGFLQLPPQLAVRLGVLGCNLHVLKKTSRSYMEEVAMVEFLSSSSGSEYRRRYGQKKKELADAIARKEQDINKYSEEKTTIIEEIFAAARREGFLKEPESEPATPKWDQEQDAEFPGPPTVSIPSCSTRLAFMFSEHPSMEGSELEELLQSCNTLVMDPQVEPPSICDVVTENVGPAWLTRMGSSAIEECA
jgi:GrpB-like predicted nucleotidyltransferase (UPF0157 family)